MCNQPFDSEFLEALQLAAGCGASPAQILTVALAFIDADTIDEALDRLVARRKEIADAVAKTPAPHRALAPEPRGPQLARMRLDIADHEVRGKLLFGELTGKRSFMQVAALAIAGRDVSSTDALLLDQLAVIAQVADPRIWPLAVTRRAATSQRPFSAQLLAGTATMLNPYMGARPVTEFVAMCESIEAACVGDTTLATWLDERLGKGERLPGAGRPILKGIDERIPPMLEAAEHYGRGNGPSLRLAKQIEQELMARKGIRLNAAGMFAALLRDMGFSARAAGAFAQFCLTLPVLMHATLD